MIQARTSHSICRISKMPMLAFSETAEKVFEHGPERLRSWSKFVKYVIFAVNLKQYWIVLHSVMNFLMLNAVPCNDNVDCGTYNWSKYNIFRHFCDYGLMAAYYGCLCVYIIIIAQATHDIVNYNCNINWSVRVYIGISTIAVLLIGQVMRHWEKILFFFTLLRIDANFQASF